MIDAITISTDNRVSVIELQPGLHALQSSVGGHVEAVRSATGETTLWINEDGKVHGLPENRLGTWLMWHLNPATRGHDFLVGPVVITGGPDPDGKTCGVGPEAFAALRELRRIVRANAKAAS